MPELLSPSGSSSRDFFFFYSICGYPLIENLKNIQEVCYPCKTDIEGQTFSLRGLKMPVINCYKLFGLPYKSFDADRLTVMVINNEGAKNGSADGIYAVPIDDLDINAIIYTRIGCAVPAKQGHAFADYARECWDVIGGDQVAFADWKKLTS
jgi:chemotaxis signal transduction protein